MIFFRVRLDGNTEFDINHVVKFKPEGKELVITYREPGVLENRRAKIDMDLIREVECGQ